MGQQCERGSLRCHLLTASLGAGAGLGGYASAPLPRAEQREGGEGNCDCIQPGSQVIARGEFIA